MGRALGERQPGSAASSAASLTSVAAASSRPARRRRRCGRACRGRAACRRRALAYPQLRPVRPAAPARSRARRPPASPTPAAPPGPSAPAPARRGARARRKPRRASGTKPCSASARPIAGKVRRASASEPWPPARYRHPGKPRQRPREFRPHPADRRGTNAEWQVVARQPDIVAGGDMAGEAGIHGRHSRKPAAAIAAFPIATSMPHGAMR